MEDNKNLSAKIDNNALNMSATPQYRENKNQTSLFDFMPKQSEKTNANEVKVDEVKIDEVIVPSKAVDKIVNKNNKSTTSTKKNSSKSSTKKTSSKTKTTAKKSTTNTKKKDEIKVDESVPKKDIAKLYEEVKSQKLQEKDKREYFASVLNFDTLKNLEQSKNKQNEKIDEQSKFIFNAIDKTIVENSDNQITSSIEIVDEKVLKNEIGEKQGAEEKIDEIDINSVNVVKRDTEKQDDKAKVQENLDDKIDINKVEVSPKTVDKHEKTTQSSLENFNIEITSTLEKIDINKVEVVNLAKYKRGNRYVYTREIAHSQEIAKQTNESTSENFVTATTPKKDIVEAYNAVSQSAQQTSSLDIDSVNINPEYVGNFANLYKNSQVANADIQDSEELFPFDIDIDAIKSKKETKNQVVNFYNQKQNIKDEQTTIIDAESTIQNESNGWLIGLIEAFKRLPENIKNILTKRSQKEMKDNTTQKNNENIIQKHNDNKVKNNQLNNSKSNLEYEYSRIQCIDRAVSQSLHEYKEK